MFYECENVFGVKKYISLEDVLCNVLLSHFGYLTTILVKYFCLVSFCNY